MTWTNRFRLLGGLIVVLLVVAGATLVLSQRESQVASRSASIEALPYSVGSDYAGTVVEQFVQEDDAVREGDKLLSIQSTTLLRDLAAEKREKRKHPESTAYTVNKDGILTLVATEPGVVSRIDARVGGFVSAGEPLASIDRQGSLHVLADFRVDPYDFARIEEGAEVDIVLPDHQRIRGQVARVGVDTVGGQADAQIEVSSGGLIDGQHGGLVSPGTPVTAIMHLRDEGPLAGVKNSLFALLEQVGL